jgi:tetratricopeptide (TPR) repeat protein
MSLDRTPVRRTLRLLLLSAACSLCAAHADEYSEVSQLIRSKQLVQALDKADQHLAGKPRDPQMRFLKGVIQTESGKPQEAIGTFSQLTLDYPELPEPYNNLAVLYAAQNQLDSARAALEMALRADPGYAIAYENLGDLYLQLASQAYQKAQENDRSNAGIPQKLTLIRELLATGNKTRIPATTRPAS